MVSKKDRDAEGGLQVFSVLGIFWTIGFFYWTRNDVLSGSGMGQLSMACCNIINFLLTTIFLASWRYTHKENQVKNHIKEYILTHNSVSVKYLADKFGITDSSALRIMTLWMNETEVRGDYDHLTGIFRREPVETVSQKIIDIEFHDIPTPDRPDAGTVEKLGFCPDCGGKLTVMGDNQDMWCDNCGKYIQ